MKLRFLALLICAFCFGCSENKTESTISAIQSLCECENSQGKTIDAMTKEFFGSDIYSNSPNSKSFSDAINGLDAPLRDAWYNAIFKDFFADTKYMNCAKNSISSVKEFFENGLNKNEEENLIKFLDQTKHYAIYRTLPVIIEVVQDSESK